MKHIILRLAEVKRLSGYPRSTLYLHIKQGLWPKPIKLGERSVGWLEHEVAKLNSARVAGFSRDEIKALVSQLHVARSQAMAEMEGSL